jgi:hypothetical protein
MEFLEQEVHPLQTLTCREKMVLGIILVAVQLIHPLEEMEQMEVREAQGLVVLAIAAVPTSVLKLEVFLEEAEVVVVLLRLLLRYTVVQMVQLAN